MIGHGGLLSVFLHLPDKGFWVRLGNLTTSMPRNQETRCFAKIQLRYARVG